MHRKVLIDPTNIRNVKNGTQKYLKED